MAKYMSTRKEIVFFKLMKSLNKKFQNEVLFKWCKNGAFGTVPTVLA
jgi:hypothetical protein